MSLAFAVLAAAVATTVPRARRANSAVRRALPEEGTAKGAEAAETCCERQFSASFAGFAVSSEDGAGCPLANSAVRRALLEEGTAKGAEAAETCCERQFSASFAGFAVSSEDGAGCPLANSAVRR